MRKYRIVTVHQVTQKVRRSHELEAEGIAEVGGWLAQGPLPYVGERIEESEQTLLEATITDVTHCYQEEDTNVGD